MEHDTNNHTPLYLSALQALRCGVSEGWYAADCDGNLRSGPFLSRESCLKAAIGQGHDGAVKVPTPLVELNRFGSLVSR